MADAMTTAVPDDDPVARTLALAGEAAGCRLHLVERLSGAARRNLVLRVRDDGGRLLIVKRTAIKAGVADWLSPAFLGLVAPGRDHAPGIRGCDPAQGILVVEDLGDPPSLVPALTGDDPTTAVAGLDALARRLGALHADTAGHFAGYAALLARHRPDADPPGPAATFHTLGRTDLAALPGMPSLPSDEIAAIQAEIADPGPFFCLIHRDPCPDNVLLAEGQARLVDFEFAHYGHALADAAYVAMGFPSCWCAGTVPDDVATRFLATYRRAAAAMPVMADERAFAHAFALVAGGWLLQRLGWLYGLAATEDAPWGIATRRARVLNDLDAFIGIAGRAQALPGLVAAMSDLRRSLAQTWPETEPLRPYQAFLAPRPLARLSRGTFLP